MNLVGVSWSVWAVIGGLFLVMGVLPLLFVLLLISRTGEKMPWFFPLVVLIVLFAFGQAVFTVIRRDVLLEADGLHINGYSQMQVPYSDIENVVVYASRAVVPKLRNKTNGMAIPGSIYAGWISCDAMVPCYVEAVPTPNIGIYLKNSATVRGSKGSALILLEVTDPQAMAAALKEKGVPENGNVPATHDAPGG